MLVAKVSFTLTRTRPGAWISDSDSSDLAWRTQERPRPGPPRRPLTQWPGHGRLLGRVLLVESNLNANLTYDPSHDVQLDSESRSFKFSVQVQVVPTDSLGTPSYW